MNQTQEEYRTAARQVVRSFDLLKAKTPKAQPFALLSQALMSAPMTARQHLTDTVDTITRANVQRPVGECVAMVVEKLREIAAPAPTPAIPPQHSGPRPHIHPVNG